MIKKSSSGNIKIIMIISAVVFVNGCGNSNKEETSTAEVRQISQDDISENEIYRSVQEAREHNNKGEHLEAIEILKEIHKLHKENKLIRENLIAVYYNYGVKLLKEENFYGVETYLEEALGYFPDSALLKGIHSIALSRHAYAEYNKGNREEAARLLEEAVAHNEARADSYSLLGDIYSGKEDYEKAISCWENALRIDPSLINVNKKLEKLKREHKVESSFLSQKLRHFEVRFNGIETYGFAWEVLKVLDEAYYEVGGEFGLFPSKKFLVIIYTGKEFEKALMLPDWIKGLYDGKIRIRIGDLKGDSRQLRELLYHEYTHALLHCILGSNIPTWLNEGIAQYEEPGSFIKPSEKDLLSRHLKAGHLLSLDGINHAIGGGSDSIDEISLAYIQAKSLTHYIADRFGKYSMRLIVNELANTENIDTAIKKVLGTDLKTLESDWKDSLG